MAGNITNELVSKLGMKKLSKGDQSISVENGEVNVDVALNIDYGYSVPKTSRNGSGTSVKHAIENMTGLTVSDVNVTIASVCMEKHD